MSEKNLTPTNTLSVIQLKDRVQLDQIINEVFHSDNGLADVDERLRNLDPNDDRFPALQVLLQSLGSHLLGINYLRAGSFAGARDHFKAAVEGFDKIGESELRDVGVGLATYAEATLEAHKGDFEKAKKLIADAQDYLRKAGKYEQLFEVIIDHMMPEYYAMQAIQSLSSKDIAMTKALIEQTASASEKVAITYYEEDTPGYFTFMGLARYYKGFYQVNRAINSFTELNYDGLANEIGLTRDATAARDLLSKGDLTNPMVQNAFHLSEGVIEVLELIKELAPTMQKIFNSTFKPDPETYASLRQRIQKANDCFGPVGVPAATLLRFCDQLSNQVNNLERLAKPQMLQVESAVFSIRETAAHDSFKKFQELMLDSLDEPLKQLSRWSTLTLVLVGVSVTLIIVGAASAMFLGTRVSVLTSISSVFSSIISSLLYIQLRQARTDVKEARLEVIKQYKESSERFFGSN